MRGAERGGLVALVVLAAVARAEEPTVRKLDPGAAAPVPPSSDEAPARRLPATVAVCLDRDAGRCWVAPRGEDCRPGAEFRVVIDDSAGAEATAALADCRTSLGGAKSP